MKKFILMIVVALGIFAGASGSVVYQFDHIWYKI